MIKRILKALKNIADECAMGMYAEEIDAKITLPNIQPSKLRPAIKRIRNKMSILQYSYFIY